MLVWALKYKKVIVTKQIRGNKLTLIASMYMHVIMAR